MILALLLAKRGVRVLVCERHDNFDREFRGEVLMPRFSQILEELGLLSFLQSKHHLKFSEVEIFNQGKILGSFSLEKIAPELPYATWMAQPVMLEAFYEKSKQFPAFEMWFGATLKDLIKANQKVAGAVVDHQGKLTDVRAKIVVGADGRMSAVKRSADFGIAYEEHNFDIVWFNVKKPAGYRDAVRGFFSKNHNYLILPKYPDLLQCGIIVPKNEFQNYIKKGIGAIQKELLEAHPVLHEFASQLTNYHVFSVLQARVHLVKKWALDGCLLIGDAAHTCSPAGAVGVSVAVQTAVVAAQTIYEAVQKNDFSGEFLGKIQRQREDNVREIHQLQKRVFGFVFPKNAMIKGILPVVMSVLIKMDFLRKMQRKLFVLDHALKLDKEFKFS